ncbi:MAG: acyl carrier protein [Novosphingobium sp.]
MGLENELLEIIEKEAMIERNKLSREATLEELGIASIDVISVLFAIEEKYDVVIEGEELAGATTLGDFIDLLAAKVAAK